MERLAGAGFQPAQVETAFISHLHMDHIGGLQGLIGLRWFTGAQNMLTIYGPPGTDVLVAGIIQSLRPSVRIGLGIPLQVPTPEQQTRVVIVKDGADLNVDGVRVRAVRNSHFDDPPGHPPDDGSQSLSYRFDYNGYGIGFTGDTGPSDAVARLEKGVDLLMSEVMDVPAMIAVYTQSAKLIPPQAKAAVAQHFKTQHLTPQEAGKIAAEAGVRRLVFTHLGIPGTTDADAPKLIREAHETFKGEVIVAHDLDRF
jgi:ribonuclease BN (tRNA processing enzyme)